MSSTTVLDHLSLGHAVQVLQLIEGSKMIPEGPLLDLSTFILTNNNMVAKLTKNFTGYDQAAAAAEPSA